MTTPITGFEQIEPIAQPTYNRLKVANTDEFFVGIRAATNAALARNLIHYLGVEGRAAGITVKLTDPNGVDSHADEGDSIVLTYHGEDLYAITPYNGPAGTYNNPLYSATFPEVG